MSLVKALRQLFYLVKPRSLFCISFDSNPSIIQCRVSANNAAENISYLGNIHIGSVAGHLIVLLNESVSSTETETLTLNKNRLFLHSFTYFVLSTLIIVNFP